jgi:A/G-specific adenine glycosylase
VVIDSAAGVLLRQCGDNERWAGMWDFPRFEISRTPPNQRELAAGVEQLTGIRIGAATPLHTIKYGVTRFRITLHCFRAPLRAGRSAANAGNGLRWLRPTQLATVPLSVSGRKIAELL